LSKDRTQFNAVLVWYFFYCAILSGFFMIFDFTIPNMKEFFYLLLIGIFGYFFQYMMTKALQYAPVRLISPIMYFSVLFAGGFDWLIWGITPHTFTIIGAAMTILGAIYVILNRKTLPESEC